MTTLFYCMTCEDQFYAPSMFGTVDTCVKCLESLEGLNLASLEIEEPDLLGPVKPLLGVWA